MPCFQAFLGVRKVCKADLEVLCETASAVSIELLLTLTFMPPPGGTNRQREERRILGVLPYGKDLPKANRRSS